jgi:iron complex outermembrane receptor protein
LTKNYFIKLLTSMNMNECYKTLLAVALLLVFGLSTASAQKVTISGKVTADDTGESLPGVSILEKGTTSGAVTDIEGAYSFSATQGATLVFSFVGYISKEVVVGSQSTINVQLASDVQQLSEIVVIGYGQVEKDDLTGSVTAVGQEDFNKGAIVSAQDLLSGRVAGLQITNTGGAPGASSRIRIRGGSSINASNEPLVVIDGMPVANDEFSGMRNPMSVVNPNDIESISVLKTHLQQRFMEQELPMA